MAQSIHFPGVNRVWKGWEADPATGREPVNDLSVMSTEQGEQISCWQLTEAERVEVARTGVVWLAVVGAQPPVIVAGSLTALFHGEPPPTTGVIQ